MDSIDVEERKSVLAWQTASFARAPILPLGATALSGKAVDELGTVGVAAAIADAVYYAIGPRVCELPNTVDKLIG